MEGFKVICNKCGREINTEDMKNDDSNDIEIEATYDTYVGIKCKCGNCLYR